MDYTMPQLAEMAIKEARGVNAAARALGLWSARSVTAWRDGDTIPEPENEPLLQRLATLIHVPFDEVMATVRRDRRLRAAKHWKGDGLTAGRNGRFPRKPPVAVATGPTRRLAYAGAS